MAVIPFIIYIVAVIVIIVNGQSLFETATFAETSTVIAGTSISLVSPTRPVSNATLRDQFIAVIGVTETSASYARTANTSSSTALHNGIISSKLTSAESRTNANVNTASKHNEVGARAADSANESLNKNESTAKRTFIVGGIHSTEDYTKMSKLSLNCSTPKPTPTPARSAVDNSNGNRASRTKVLAPISDKLEILLGKSNEQHNQDNAVHLDAIASTASVVSKRVSSDSTPVRSITNSTRQIVEKVNANLMPTAVKHYALAQWNELRVNSENDYTNASQSHPIVNNSRTSSAIVPQSVISSTSFATASALGDGLPHRLELLANAKSNIGKEHQSALSAKNSTMDMIYALAKSDHSNHSYNHGTLQAQAQAEGDVYHEFSKLSIANRTSGANDSIQVIDNEYRSMQSEQNNRLYGRNVNSIDNVINDSSGRNSTAVTKSNKILSDLERNKFHSAVTEHSQKHLNSPAKLWKNEFHATGKSKSTAAGKSVEAIFSRTLTHTEAFTDYGKFNKSTIDNKREPMSTIANTAVSRPHTFVHLVDEISLNREFTRLSESFNLHVLDTNNAVNRSIANETKSVNVHASQMDQVNPTLPDNRQFMDTIKINSKNKTRNLSQATLVVTLSPVAQKLSMSSSLAVQKANDSAIEVEEMLENPTNASIAIIASTERSFSHSHSANDVDNNLSTSVSTSSLVGQQQMHQPSYQTAGDGSKLSESNFQNITMIRDSARNEASYLIKNNAKVASSKGSVEADPLYQLLHGDVHLGGKSIVDNFLVAAITAGHEIAVNQLTVDNQNVNATKERLGNSNNGSVIATWPVKHAAIVEGDVILGGLMMVHSREDTITCGPIMPQGGIQALEVMLYTLDRINSEGLLPNFTLGAHILDDCDKDTYGLEMAVDFIKGSISNIDGGEYHCNKTQVRKVISGVVGAASSVTSIQVANLLRLFRIPQVSFFSTTPELSNKQRFEYFSRTIPSDHYQVKAMVDIVRRMGWSYVSIIYEESNYGIKAFEELEDLLAKHNICIAVKEKLVKDSGVAEAIAYDNIVQKLLTKPRARGAIIFGSDQEVREVMRAVRRNNATGVFSWIGSDGWSARNLVSDGNEPEVEGTLSVQPQANPVLGFEEHFLGLNVENNERNPWFVEFWEDHFQCRYPNSSLTPYNKKYKRMCTAKEKLQKNTTAFEDQLQFVSDAVMAFAYALSDMHKELCHGVSGLCDAMRPTKGADLLKYLRKVNFTGLSGDRFHFNSNGDGPARYNIIHFKQEDPNKYRWVKVGEYYEGELRLNMTEVQFKYHQPKPPESVCSLPCEKGQAKKYVEGESCCWHCFNCSLYQIRSQEDETQCITCNLGTLPDRFKERCQDIPEQYLRLKSGWAIGAMAFSSTGMLITFFVVGVFLRHNDTPVVRASGRELSYVLLAGIVMCYAVTFALVLRPTDVTCGIQRFGAGFCFTVVYGALLTKTNRISRIFKHGKQSAKRPSFISPRSQLVICAALTSVQVIINVIWMIISPARAMHHYPTREDNLLVCDSYVDASYMVAFSYPIFLIVICTVYAVLTRKIPEAFNESKHIGFTMYTTCVIWLAFVPLYFATGNHVPLRLTSMSVTISLSASVTVACLFSPKLYIILIRPERNVRQSMMPVRYSAMNKTTGTGPSSMMAAIMVTAATCNQNEKIEKQSTLVPEDANKLKVPSAGSNGTNSGYTAGENGCVKFVEIATQTVNLTNFLTNLSNNSLTNCNINTELHVDSISSIGAAAAATSQLVSSTTMPANTLHDGDVINHTCSEKGKNGHCIIDGLAVRSESDDTSRMHNQLEPMRSIDASDTLAETQSIHNVKESSSISPQRSVDSSGISFDDPEMCLDDQELESMEHIDLSVANSEAEVSSASLAAARSTAPPQLEQTTSDASSDLAKSHTATDAVNGPSSDLYV